MKQCCCDITDCVYVFYALDYVVRGIWKTEIFGLEKSLSAHSLTRNSCGSLKVISVRVASPRSHAISQRTRTLLSAGPGGIIVMLWLRICVCWWDPLQKRLWLPKSPAPLRWTWASLGLQESVSFRSKHRSLYSCHQSGPAYMSEELGNVSHPCSTGFEGMQGSHMVWDLVVPCGGVGIPAQRSWKATGEGEALVAMETQHIREATGFPPCSIPGVEWWWPMPTKEAVDAIDGSHLELRPEIGQGGWMIRHLLLVLVLLWCDYSLDRILFMTWTKSTIWFFIQKGFHC